MIFIQQGENDTLKRRVYLHLVDAIDGITARTGQTGSAYISINGKPPRASVNSIVEIDSTSQPGTYYLELTAGELKDGGFVVFRYKNSQVAEFVDIIQVVAFDPYGQQHHGGGTAGNDIDYKKVRKIIQEELSALPKPQNPEPLNIPFYLQPIQNAIAGIRNDLRSIEIPETDFSGIEYRLEGLQKAIESAKKAIQSLHIPETDLTPVLEEIESLTSSIQPYTDKTSKDAEALLQRVRQFYLADIEAIQREVAGIKAKLEAMPFVVMSPTQKTEAPKPEPVDYSLLLNN